MRNNSYAAQSRVARVKRAVARTRRERKNFENIRGSRVFKLSQWRNLLLAGLRN